MAACNYLVAISTHGFRAAAMTLAVRASLTAGTTPWRWLESLRRAWYMVCCRAFVLIASAMLCGAADAIPSLLFCFLGGVSRDKRLMRVTFREQLLQRRR